MRSGLVLLGAHGICRSNICGRRGRRPSWIVMRVAMRRQRCVIRATRVRPEMDPSFAELRNFPAYSAIIVHDLLCVGDSK